VRAALVLVAVALASTACGGGGGGGNDSTGGRIAYETPDGALWVANADGTGRMRLTQAGSGSQPTLAPDGTLIAFGRNSGYTGRLFTVPTSGGKPTLVGPLSGGRVVYFAWSPDATKLVSVKSKDVVLTDLRDGSSTVIATAALGRALIDRATFSPDGSQIAYDYYVGRGAEIRIFDIEKRSTHAVARGHADTWPLWGEGGLAFSRGSDQDADIWLVPSSESAPRRLTQTGTGLHAMGWSADGKSLVAASPGIRNWGIDVPSGTARDITGDGGLIASGISRDGSTVLALSPCGSQGRGKLQTLPFEGGEPHVLVEGACYGTWNR
jgi:Tol biopolymer transport system component